MIRRSAAKADAILPGEAARTPEERDVDRRREPDTELDEVQREQNCGRQRMLIAERIVTGVAATWESVWRWQLVPTAAAVGSR